MSCSGCRVLRKGCGESCILRPCLQWIDSPAAQGHATLFVAKFFGRSDLMSFISGVPHHQRSALFQSLLFEACGRTINPVNGAVGLMWSGNWDLCKSAVDTVLSGGTPHPLPEFIGHVNDPYESLPRRRTVESMVATHEGYFEYGFPCMQDTSSRGEYKYNNAVSFCNEETSGMTSFGEERKILNLFV